MLKLIDYVNRYFTFLHTFDTSLAIYIHDTNVFIIGVRKYLRNFKVIHKENFVISSTNEKEFLNELIRSIKQKKIRAEHIVINLPRDGYLTKVIEMPFIPFDTIEEYLYQHPELYLPPGITLDSVKLDFKVIEAYPFNQTKIKIFILIIKKQYLNAFLEHIKGLNISYVIYATLLWVDFIPIFYPDFTGLVLNVEPDEIICFTFREGYLENFYRSSLTIESMSNYLKRTMDILGGEEEGFDILFSGNLKQIESLKKNIVDSKVKVKEVFLDIEKVKVAHNYYNAFLIGISPFYKTRLKNLFCEFNKGDKYFYKNLFKKNVIFLVLLFLIFQASLFSINAFLKIYRDKVFSEYNEIKPTILKREKLLDKYKILEKFWGDMEFLLKGETYIAKYLKIIIEQMPPLLWLSNISMDFTSSNKLILRLEGYVVDDKDFYMFLERLQKNDLIKKVEVVYFNIKEKREMKEKIKVRSNLIYKFNLNIYV